MAWECVVQCKDFQQTAKDSTAVQSRQCKARQYKAHQRKADSAKQAVQGEANRQRSLLCYFGI